MLPADAGGSARRADADPQLERDGRRASRRGAPGWRGRAHPSSGSKWPGGSAERVGTGDEPPRCPRPRTMPWRPARSRIRPRRARTRVGPCARCSPGSGGTPGRHAAWSDVDLTLRELLVRQQRVDVGNRVIEEPVKAAAGQDRRGSLGGEAVAALVEWKQLQTGERQLWDNEWIESRYVVTRERSHPERTASPRPSSGEGGAPPHVRTRPASSARDTAARGAGRHRDPYAIAS